MTLTLDLSGRVALVTGGARGIGRGVSAVLVEAGARVITCGRSDAEPAPGTEHRVCDVRDGDEVAALVEAIVASHGRLDVLVNNAGGAPYALAEDSSRRLDDKILGLNLEAVLAVAKAAHAVMRTQSDGGAIVNISSVSAVRPSPGTATYGAAKAGVDSLTRSLAVEWGPQVRVNSIDVGLCRTEQTDDHYGGDAAVAAIEATIPLGRMAEPQEIGQVVAFLASDLAGYVSGANLACHGGGEPPVFLHITKEKS
ncbi:SDR family oxidoreductase [Aeromicrobium sp. CTD01-1L150]|uniref:SDR family oxidoreductase n=1 Tax=Aeromicrobium sp. CTD01-1L150 TaxID=3341830 RepID=UPI0035C0EF93